MTLLRSSQNKFYRQGIETEDQLEAGKLLRHVEGLSNDELAGMFQLEKNNVAERLNSRSP